MTSPVDSTLLTNIAVAILSVFSGGTIASLFRVRADRQHIVVQAAQGAVVVQSSVIDDLQDELQRLRAEMGEREKEIQRLRQRVLQLERHQK